MGMQPKLLPGDSILIALRLALALAIGASLCGGCNIGAECQDKLGYCENLDLKKDCEAANGCNWGAGCFPIRCDALSKDEAMCGAVPYCDFGGPYDKCRTNWNLRPSCEVDAATCSETDFCVYEVQCTGTPNCLAHGSAQSCGADPMCQWYPGSDALKLGNQRSSSVIDSLMAGAGSTGQ